ncbi:MAG: type II toxin-antitoxin system HicA family toxin [Candidatus Acidiferrales bacterium]
MHYIVFCYSYVDAQDSSYYAEKASSCPSSDRLLHHHQRGSHVNLRHVTKPHLHVVVPNHGHDLAPKTLRSILVQAEITPEEFITLLNK